LGLACNCQIVQHNYFARKNYFYPDLPKGYQISQHTTPICKNGFLEITVGKETKKIRLNRIHMEEDAGKSLHDENSAFSNLDFNRAGMPLLEIVTEPDLRSAEEAFAYVSEIRKLVRYLEICDGNMEEGSLRCDANVSVRKKGDEKLGTKVEVKNLNSIRNVKRAIEIEADRLIALLEKAEPIIQQTRSFDANNNTTFAIRDKEDADDYRYFAEPDLAPFHLEELFIERIKNTIPALPEERVKKYREEFKLSEYDAGVLTEERAVSDYFESVASSLVKGESTSHLYKAAANWMLGPVKSWLNETGQDITSFPITSSKLAELVQLVDQGKLSFSVASGKLFSQLLVNPAGNPEQMALEQNLIQQSDSSALDPNIDKVLDKLADKVVEYKKGKKGLLALFVGEVMKQSKGKADPKIANQLILEKLK